MRECKVVFMGTPDFAVPVLKMLIEKVNVVLVVTQPDKEVGRKRELRFSPVKEVAMENNIEVFQPNKIKNDFEKIRILNPDLIITCAYGQLLPLEILDISQYGSINVHASLLPKYRGSAPIQWALLNGEEKTGVTLMYMDAGMDTGDIFAKREIKIEENDNVGTLHDKLAILGANLLEDNLSDIINALTKREKQDNSLATNAPMIKREDEIIDFNCKGKDIINKIRAFSPWPLAYVKLKEVELKIIEASFAEMVGSVPGKVEVTKNRLGIEVLDGIIYLEKVKPFGKKEMDIKSYLNGINKDKIV